MTPTLSHREARVWFAEQLREWGDALLFNPTDMQSDLNALESAFPDAAEYAVALAETLRQLSVIAGRRPGTDMRGRLLGWRRHAFQSAPKLRGSKACGSCSACVPMPH